MQDFQKIKEMTEGKICLSLLSVIEDKSQKTKSRIAMFGLINNV